MTEDRCFKWSSESLCFCLYLGLNPGVLYVPTRPEWQIQDKIQFVYYDEILHIFSNFEMVLMFYPFVLIHILAG